MGIPTSRGCPIQPVRTSGTVKRLACGSRATRESGNTTMGGQISASSHTDMVAHQAIAGNAGTCILQSSEKSEQANFRQAGKVPGDPHCYLGYYFSAILFRLLFT